MQILIFALIIMQIEYYSCFWFHWFALIHFASPLAGLSLLTSPSPRPYSASVFFRIVMLCSILCDLLSMFLKLLAKQSKHCPNSIETPITSVVKNHFSEHEQSTMKLFPTLTLIDSSSILNAFDRCFSHSLRVSEALIWYLSAFIAIERARWSEPDTLASRSWKW